MNDGRFEVEQTKYGFHWGPAVVERIAVLPSGAVVLYVTGTGPGAGVEVWISPKGRKVRVFQWNQEWKPSGPRRLRKIAKKSPETA